MKLWACPACGRTFANRNQIHSCAPLGSAPGRRPRFRRIEVYSPRNVLHVFRLTVPDDVDAEFTAYLAEAYGVGAQQHLRRRAPE